MSHSDSAIPDWAQAHGAPVCCAAIRTVPGDFFVNEVLSFDADGGGEHDFLLIEKTGANTAWVARQLAGHAGVPAADVGYAGLKDRNAVTRQAFTVRRPNRDGTDWSTLNVEGVLIQKTDRHGRKLRRGAHQLNQFVIRLRGTEIDDRHDALAARISAIAGEGVPNYFGEQRFGRGGANIELARSVLAGKRVKRGQRSIALSAARALIFNTILDARVRDGSWNRILDGELANLNGSGSVFAVDAATAELQRRCREQDIHPTASLWGDGAPRSTAAVADLERDSVSACEEVATGLVKARVEASHRPLRLLVHDLESELRNGMLVLRFALRKGGYATAVLRELVQTGLE